MAARAKKDEDYQELIRKVTAGVNFEKLEESDPHRVHKDRWQDLRILATVAGNLVYADNCLVLPKPERPNLITQSHPSHLNFESIYATQRKFWWWPEMKAEIKEEWQQCPECTRCKKSKMTTPPLFPIETMSFNIGELWSVDLFEFKGKYYILGIDKACQYIFIDEIRNKKTATVTRSLENFALMLGLPTLLKSNGGPCSKSKPFQEFTNKYGIEHVMTSTYHHQSNGQAERAIQEAEKMMEKMDKYHLYHVAFMFNKT